MLAQSGDLYSAALASSRKWARSGPVISWRTCSTSFPRNPVDNPAPTSIPEIEGVQANEQAKQWDGDLQAQLQRAGYLATRLVRWHAPASPAVPASPPMQLPAPATPLDATPDWPAGWADDESLQQAALDAEEVFADDRRSAFEARLRVLPPPVKRVLRAGILVLRWHIALCYWTAMGALGASVAAAAVLTACRVLPLSDQGTLSVTSWAPVASSTSVLTTVPLAARQARNIIIITIINIITVCNQVSAALSRSLSASLSAFGNHTWLRPNIVVPRAGLKGAGVLYRWLRNRVVVLPGLRHLAAARGRELGELLRQLTPSSPLFGLAKAAEATPSSGVKQTGRRGARRTPATPAEQSAAKGAPKSAARRRAAVVAAAEDSPAAGTRSATRRAARA